MVMTSSVAKLPHRHAPRQNGTRVSRCGDRSPSTSGRGRVRPEAYAVRPDSAMLELVLFVYVANHPHAAQVEPRTEL